MEKVKAKFYVTETGQHQYGRDEVTHNVKMRPVYSQDPESENHAFWKATPVGDFSMGTLNANLGEFFEIGAEYYITIEKA